MTKNIINDVPVPVINAWVIKNMRIRVNMLMCAVVTFQYNCNYCSIIVPVFVLEQNSTVIVIERRSGV